MVLIYLDAGHGGRDGGASANGIKEKDIVLTLVDKMQSLLKKYKDVDVAVSRADDVFVTLNERTQTANKMNADCLLSIHVNSSTKNTARGFESFRYSDAGSSTTAFHNVIHEEIMNAINEHDIDNRGKKTANFHMLRETKMKAILTENLFISNSKDATLLKNDSFLDKLATGHVNGLEKFFGLQKINDEITGPTEDQDKKLHKVQVGAYEEKKNADGIESDLIKQGFTPFVKYEDELYKVQVGAFEKRENAQDLVDKLRELGYRPIIIFEF